MLYLHNGVIFYPTVFFAVEWRTVDRLLKVIIDKSRGEVALLEQDTIENVS